MKAMILAAGLGTRLKPWTNYHPKALAVAGGKTLLERQIRYLQAFGIFDVVINVHHFPEQIIEILEKNEGWGSNFVISREDGKPLETGGGLKKATHLLKDAEEIVLMNVDVLTDLDLGSMLQHHRSKKAIATLAVSDRDTSRYFLFDDQSRLGGWKNSKTGITKIVRPVSCFIEKAFSGIHIINNTIFSLLPSDEKFSIVDFYLEIAGNNPIYGFDHSGGIFLDVGKPEALAFAELIISEL